MICGKVWTGEPHPSRLAAARDRPVRTLALALVLLSTPALARKPPPEITAAALAAARARPLAGHTLDTRDLLLAIAEHESRFRPDIARCAVLGDHGRAHGTYQLHPEAFGDHSAAEVCASPRLQARLALFVLHAYLKLAPELGVEGAVRGYASGRPRQATSAAREIMALWRARRAARRARP